MRACAFTLTIYIDSLAQMFGLRLQRHWFARSRLRRQMQFAPERKNLALAPEVRSQVATLREEYQEDLARPQLFSDVLFQQQQPKLGKVFKVDERRLAKVSSITIIAGSEGTS